MEIIVVAAAVCEGLDIFIVVRTDEVPDKVPDEAPKEREQQRTAEEIQAFPIQEGFSRRRLPVGHRLNRRQAAKGYAE